MDPERAAVLTWLQRQLAWEKVLTLLRQAADARPPVAATESAHRQPGVWQEPRSAA